MWLQSRFLYAFGSLKFRSKVNHYWPFCFAIAFAKWPFLPFLECEVFFPGRFLGIVRQWGVFSRPFSQHSATVMLLLLCVFCFQCVLRCTQRKSDKDFIGGRQIVAAIFFFSCSKHHACQDVQYMEIKITCIIVLNFRKAHAYLLITTIPRHTYPYHLEERIGTLWYIYENYLL